MVASGVRRSCETARSSAVEVASARSRFAARSSRSRSRRYSSTSPVCTANASSTRWSLARSGSPQSASTWLSSTRTRVSPSSGVAAHGAPDDASTTQPAGPCSSSETASWPNVSRSRSTIASAVSWPVSTDLDSPLIVAASARARSASAARRDARSTTVATAAATATNTTSASRFFGSETVSVPTGGVKK